MPMPGARDPRQELAQLLAQAQQGNMAGSTMQPWAQMMDAPALPQSAPIPQQSPGAGTMTPSAPMLNPLGGPAEDPGALEGTLVAPGTDPRSSRLQGIYRDPGLPVHAVPGTGYSPDWVEKIKILQNAQRASRG